MLVYFVFFHYLLIRTSGNFENIETPKDSEYDSIAENDGDLNLNRSSDHVNHFNSEPLEPQTETISQKRQSPSVAARQSKRHVPQTNAFQSQLLDLLKEPELNILQDPDNMMLLSFSPKYKKLNEDQKIDFQMQMLQFFKNINRPMPPLFNQPIIQELEQRPLYRPPISANNQATQSYSLPDPYSQFITHSQNSYQPL